MYTLDPLGHRLAVTYKDLRSVPEFNDKTILAVKAPQDTILNCDIQEVRLGCEYPSRLWGGYWVLPLPSG